MANDHRSTVLRTMRAWTDLNQADAATGIGISKRALVEAESGSVLTDKTWELAMTFYAGRGLFWRNGDSVEPRRLLVTGLDAGVDQDAQPVGFQTAAVLEPRKTRNRKAG